MHQPLSKDQIAAINGADRNVSDCAVNDRIVFDAGPQWFPNAARILLAPKPGLVLHLQTDCGERNGHRYAGGEVVVPSGVVRQLMRRDDGRPWFTALMEGSEAAWWLALQRAERIAAQIDSLDLR